MVENTQYVYRHVYLYNLNYIAYLREEHHEEGEKELGHVDRDIWNW